MQLSLNLAVQQGDRSNLVKNDHFSVCNLCKNR